MDLSEIKEKYYIRYGESNNYLHYLYTGALCNLLGHAEISHAPSLTCTLSMGITMLARSLSGNAVKVQDVNSDKKLTYVPPSPPAMFKGRERDTAEIILRLLDGKKRGAEILFSSSMPDFLPQDNEYFLTLVKSLARVWDMEVSPFDMALHASRGEINAQLLAAANAKSGYCTFLNEGIAQNYPLPLTGYKIVTVFPAERPSARAVKIQAAYEKIRGKYPPVSSVYDITPGHAACLKSKTVRDYMLHLAGENLRIKRVLGALKRCDNKALFDEMNASQSSMERYWQLRAEHKYLAECAKGLDGVKAVRCTNLGTVMIVETDYVDYAAGMVRREFERVRGYKPTFCVSDAV